MSTGPNLCGPSDRRDSNSRPSSPQAQERLGTGFAPGSQAIGSNSLPASISPEAVNALSDCSHDLSLTSAGCASLVPLVEHPDADCDVTSKDAAAAAWQDSQSLPTLEGAVPTLASSEHQADQLLGQEDEQLQSLSPAHHGVGPPSVLHSTGPAATCSSGCEQPMQTHSSDQFSQPLEQKPAASTQQQQDQRQQQQVEIPDSPAAHPTDCIAVPKLSPSRERQSNTSQPASCAPTMGSPTAASSQHHQTVADDERQEAARAVPSGYQQLQADAIAQVAVADDKSRQLAVVPAPPPMVAYHVQLLQAVMAGGLNNMRHRLQTAVQRENELRYPGQAVLCPEDEAAEDACPVMRLFDTKRTLLEHVPLPLAFPGWRLSWRLWSGRRWCRRARLLKLGWRRSARCGWLRSKNFRCL